MATNLNLDDKLIETARQLGGHKTTEALQFRAALLLGSLVARLAHR